MAIGSDGYYIGGDGTQHTEIPGITPTPSAVLTNINNSGITPAPFGSMLNADGSVKSQFAVDPSKSSAFETMKQNATSTDPSVWAQMQLQANQNTSHTKMVCATLRHSASYGCANCQPKHAKSQSSRPSPDLQTTPPVMNMT